jgi:hypothetical protein
VTTGRGVSRLGGLIAATALLGACIAPAFDSGAFERNAIHALDSAVSDTRTAALALEQDLSDRLVRPYADTVVTQSEDDIGPVQDSFGSVDPPTKADEKLRDHVGGLLSDAGDALAAARIALRNDDRAGMARSVRNLRSVAADMERTSERLS